MEPEEDTLTMPPFWVPNTNPRRRLRRSYSLLLTSTSLFILLLITVLVFSLVVVPTLRSFASNIFRPQAVKHSWDYLNLLLVLFAVICGFLTKNDNNEAQTPRFDRHRRSFSNPETPPPWYDYPNRSFNRLRSFGSHPDLRDHSSWVAADERFRFYDDTHLLLCHRRREPDAEEVEKEQGIENMEKVTSAEVAALPVQQPEPELEPESVPEPEPESVPEPQSPPVTRTKAVRRNAKRTHQAETEKPESNDSVAKNYDPPPPPPPPPLPAERKTNMQGKKKRGSATKEFLTSLTGKKKKQRQRSVENFESILKSEPFPLASQPPPPPPPPPPSVFNNLFSSKKSKHKKRNFVAVATHKPRLISNKRDHSYYSLEDNINNVMITGNESPLIPIPPPPPPPPFKLPAWKFRVQGDFVRIDSIGSSRSGSPVLDEVVESPTSQEETSQINSPYAPDGEGSATATASASATSLFCPSPDVDTKAHNFIESFRAGLRMAKMNSMKEKQGIGRSNLGPSPNR